MNLPRNATDFIRFMESIWDMPVRPAPNGAIELGQHPQYDRYHNAIFTALECGAILETEDPDGHTYVFPDSSRVIIDPTGRGAKPGAKAP